MVIYFNKEDDPVKVYGVTPHTNLNLIDEHLAGVVDYLTTPTETSQLDASTAHQRDMLSATPVLESTTEVLLPRRSTQRKDVPSYKGMCHMADLVCDETLFDCLPPEFHNLRSINITPPSWKQAVLLPDGDLCSKVCVEEMDSLKLKAVWTLVDRPLDRQVISGMCLFKKEILFGGKIEH